MIVKRLSRVNNFSYDILREGLKKASSDPILYEKIVNEPFKYKLKVTELSLGMLFLMMVNKATKTIDMKAVTKNELTNEPMSININGFKDIALSMKNKDSVVVRAVKTGKSVSTIDWNDLFSPVVDKQEAHFNQAGGGIGYSEVYPFKARDGGALIFCYYLYQEEIGRQQINFMKIYSKIVNQALK